MTDPIQSRFAPDTVSPPGATLAELLEEKRMTQAELAERMGRPAKTINEIINGVAAITPETALQLDRVLGVPAEFWNNRETRYRAWLAEVREKEWLAASAPWVRQFPYAALAQWGCVPPTRDTVARARSLLQYFGIASPDQWDHLWGEALLTQYRRSFSAAMRPEPVSAWLRAGEIAAAELACAEYSASKFRSVLNEARKLTGERPDSFREDLPRLCSEAGVAVVFVPTLPGCPVSGATRWISSQTPLIQLSVRYLTNDHLWFTFFHEAAHILLHGKKRRFLEGLRGALAEDVESKREEEEADRFAADFLVPRRIVDQVRERPPRSDREIRDLARECGVHAGVVVGRLQHDGLLPYASHNSMKIRFRWKADPAVCAKEE